jgi:hypothetical protein
MEYSSLGNRRLLIYADRIIPPFAAQINCHWATALAEFINPNTGHGNAAEGS